MRARAAADRLVSKLDADTGAAIRNKSLDAASVGVQRQAACDPVCSGAQVNIYSSQR